MVNVDAGLALAGRTRDDFSIVATSIVCTGRDDAEMETALAGTRGLLAFYGSTPAYRPVLDAHGWGDLQPELNTLSKQGRWDEMGALIDDVSNRRTNPGEPIVFIHTGGTPAVFAYRDELVGSVK